jgi:hypothetical protein
MANTAQQRTIIKVQKPVHVGSYLELELIILSRDPVPLI